MKRPISVGEAAEILGVSKTAIHKRIAAGTLAASRLSNKAFLVCEESVRGAQFSPAAWAREARRWISVPEACEVVCVTDAMILRMIKDDRLVGIKINGNAWAVSLVSAQKNIEEYLANPAAYSGRPRELNRSRRPAKRHPQKTR